MCVRDTCVYVCLRVENDVNIHIYSFDCVRPFKSTTECGLVCVCVSMCINMCIRFIPSLKWMSFFAQAFLCGK